MQKKNQCRSLSAKGGFYQLSPQDRPHGYVHAHAKEISLLSDDQKQSIGNIGSSTGAQLQQQFKQLAALNPGLAASLEKPLMALMPGLTSGLNGIGQTLVDGLRTDTRNMTLGAATLTQPLFMGGK